MCSARPATAAVFLARKTLALCAASNAASFSSRTPSAKRLRIIQCLSFCDVLPSRGCSQRTTYRVLCVYAFAFVYGVGMKITLSNGHAGGLGFFFYGVSLQLLFLLKLLWWHVGTRSSFRAFLYRRVCFPSRSGFCKATTVCRLISWGWSKLKQAPRGHNALRNCHWSLLACPVGGFPVV